MAKKVLSILALVLTLICIFASCDNNDNTSDDSTHTHNYGEWETTKSATCTEEGAKERYCSCGEKQTASIPATGHNFSAWTIVKEATTTEKGLKERICSCGEKETQDIDMIPIVTTVTTNEWKNVFNNFGSGDFSTVIIEMDERVTEVADNEVYGYDVTVTADFNRKTYSINGVYFCNDETDTINVFTNKELDSSNHFYTDWMAEFYFEIEYCADWGYSQFSYDNVGASYHAVMEIDDVECNVNVYFENGKIMKIALVSATNSEVTLSSIYTYTYN